MLEKLLRVLPMSFYSKPALGCMAINMRTGFLNSPPKSASKLIEDFVQRIDQAELVACIFVSVGRELSLQQSSGSAAATCDGCSLCGCGESPTQRSVPKRHGARWGNSGDVGVQIPQA